MTRPAQQLRELNAEYERGFKAGARQAEARIEKALAVLNFELRELHEQLHRTNELLTAEMRNNNRQIEVIKTHFQRRTETLKVRAERAEARIEKALALHVVMADGLCRACGEILPCPTIAALTDTEETKP